MEELKKTLRSNSTPLYQKLDALTDFLWQKINAARQEIEQKFPLEKRYLLYTSKDPTAIAFVQVYSPFLDKVNTTGYLEITLRRRDNGENFFILPKNLLSVSDCIFTQNNIRELPNDCWELDDKEDMFYMAGYVDYHIKWSMQKFHLRKWRPYILRPIFVPYHDPRIFRTVLQYVT